MTQLWRLYRARYGPGLDGIGGTFADGRWHTRGELIVYFGASAAIVVLERLAHTDPDLLPDDLYLGLFEFRKPPQTSTVTEHSVLSADWAKKEQMTRRIGADWLRNGKSSLMRVPSAILPEESNLLFNPQHSDAKLLRLVRKRRFAFDPRLV